MFRKVIKIIIIFLLATFVGFLVVQSPLLGLLIALGLLLGFLIFINPEIGLVLIILSFILGQVVRIPLPGTGAQFLPNDIIIPLTLFVWILGKLANKEFKIIKNPVNFPLFFFSGVAFVSLIWGSRNLIGREVLVSFLYLVRFLEYALLFYLVLDLVKNKRKIKNYTKLIFVSTGILAILGFLQYIFMPDFSFLAEAGGWDPHVKRMFSTWFDPNFLGGFFVFILSFILAFALFVKRRRDKILLFGLGGVLIFALVFTYSRGAFLALVVTIFLLGILKSRKLLVIGFIALLLLVAFSARLQVRLAGATRLDETARYRITSWLNTLTVAQNNLFLGVGFNAFRYSQLEYGTIKAMPSHSDFGSDSSLLTILVTTGIVGLVSYLWLLGTMFYISWRAYHKSRGSLQGALGLGMFVALSGLLIHSQFVNSLLHPHFMEVIWIFLGFNVVSIKIDSQNVQTAD